MASNEPHFVSDEKEQLVTDEKEHLPTWSDYSTFVELLKRSPVPNQMKDVTPMEMIAVLSRWTHIGTAIVLVGGLCFIRFVLSPAAEQLPDAEHSKLKELILKRWKRFVHIGIALFLISGLYSFIFVQLPTHRGDSGYRRLIEIKVVLALVLFFFASALVGRSKSFEGFRKKSKFWQLVIIVMAAVIVGISGYAKVRHPGQVVKPADASQPEVIPVQNG